jgi:hypothetical protein
VLALLARRQREASVERSAPISEDAAHAELLTEFVCLQRAREIIASLFPGEAEAQHTEALLRAVESLSVEWSSTPWSPQELSRAAQRLRTRSRAGPDSLIDQAGYDARCVRLTALAEALMAHQRERETRALQEQWACALFRAVDENRDGFIDAEGFAAILHGARPPFTEREIAQLFASLAEQGGTRQVSLEAFVELVRRLMRSGVVLVRPASSARNDTAWRHEQAVVLTVVAHWTAFRPCLAHAIAALEASKHEEDQRCAAALKGLRALFETELRVDPDDRRLVSLYRGILHVLLSHQAAFSLVKSALPTPPPSTLSMELQQLEEIALSRHREALGAGTASSARAVGQSRSDTTPAAAKEASSTQQADRFSRLAAHHNGAFRNAPSRSAVRSSGGSQQS